MEVVLSQSVVAVDARDPVERGDSGGSSVETCHAMPYAGSAPFRPPSRAADLVADQPGETRTFSLDTVEVE